jgi:predicted amidophosphoribosyltransferase
MFTLPYTWNPLDLLAPRLCLVCGQEGAAFCADCRRNLEVLPPGCAHCGYPLAGAVKAAQERAERGLPKRRKAGRVPRCSWCERLGVLPGRIRCLYAYRGEARDAFVQAKFHGYYRLIPQLLAAHACWREELLGGGYQMVVPIPERWSRLFTRHYNPAGLLARELARALGLPCRQLLAPRAGEGQLGLARAQRRVNPRFRCRHAFVGDSPRLLLVDDVLTTGGTLAAAARALQDGGWGRPDWFTLFRTL